MFQKKHLSVGQMLFALHKRPYDVSQQLWEPRITAIIHISFYDSRFLTITLTIPITAANSTPATGQMIHERSQLLK